MFSVLDQGGQLPANSQLTAKWHEMLVHNANVNSPCHQIHHKLIVGEFDGLIHQYIHGLQLEVHRCRRHLAKKNVGKTWFRLNNYPKNSTSICQLGTSFIVASIFLGVGPPFKKRARLKGVKTEHLKGPQSPLSPRHWTCVQKSNGYPAPQQRGVKLKYHFFAPRINHWSQLGLLGPELNGDKDLDSPNQNLNQSLLSEFSKWPRAMSNRGKRHVFFPHLCVGFLFLILCPVPPRPRRLRLRLPQLCHTLSFTHVFVTLTAPLRRTSLLPPPQHTPRPPTHNVYIKAKQHTHTSTPGMTFR